jgi:predicted nucleotidyltransferase
MANVAVDEAMIEEIVRRLVEAVDPEVILLFGSRARGDFHDQSDLDLLIVKPSSDLPHRRVAPAIDALWGIKAPIDILWYTPEEVEYWSEVPSHVATRATREGRVLYERSRC